MSMKRASRLGLPDVRGLDLGLRTSNGILVLAQIESFLMVGTTGSL